MRYINLCIPQHKRPSDGRKYMPICAKTIYFILACLCVRECQQVSMSNIVYLNIVSDTWILKGGVLSSLGAMQLPDFLSELWNLGYRVVLSPRRGAMQLPRFSLICGIQVVEQICNPEEEVPANKHNYNYLIGETVATY